MWFLWFTPRLPTSPISSSVITISANTIQEPRLHPARIILDFPTAPINARQPSTTKILDKRTTWILVKWHNSNLLRSQTSISDHLLKSLILNQRILIPCQSNRTSNKHYNQRNDSDPRPTSKSQHIILPESIKPTNPALDMNCLALSIVKHRA